MMSPLDSLSPVNGGLQDFPSLHFPPRDYWAEDKGGPYSNLLEDQHHGLRRSLEEAGMMTASYNVYWGATANGGCFGAFGDVTLTCSGNGVLDVMVPDDGNTDCESTSSPSQVICESPWPSSDAQVRIFSCSGKAKSDLLATASLSTAGASCSGVGYHLSALALAPYCEETVGGKVFRMTAYETCDSASTLAMLNDEDPGCANVFSCERNFCSFNLPKVTATVESIDIADHSCLLGLDEIFQPKKNDDEEETDTINNSTQPKTDSSGGNRVAFWIAMVVSATTAVVV
ncbi:unnamed protein product [Cylindrotheca closterium]|uniref:Uncharacterized protein n=1 Tax=Cylindrotheca closterium TaxID=2856 RepID=A0AAD2JJB8_9STRA|nr:unnamed protein product [Cylindrotheca closterium]